MTSNLPNPTKLLGQILREKPHTREGQIRAFDMVRGLVEKCTLGTVEILNYPVTDTLEDGEEIVRDFPLLKIHSDFGASEGKSGESILLPGHGDTVGLKGKQKTSDALVIQDGKGYGRGTLDMWGGNVAYLHALQLLRDTGYSRRAIQTILTTREEAGSEVLGAAIDAGDIDPYDLVAITEITTHEDGGPSPVYHARTGRFGYDVHITGEDAHAGIADIYPEILERTPLRGTGRAIDNSLDKDPDRHLAIVNKHPDDSTGVLPISSRVLPNRIIAEPEGLSLPDAYMHFNIFHSNPELAPEEVRSQLEEYLRGPMNNIPPECLSVNLEERHGIPFTEPWITPAGHPLIHNGHRIAEELSGTDVGLTSASGVAEDGRFSDKPIIGWAPDGKDSHKAGEYVVLDSIAIRAEWIKRLVNHEDSLA